jgi:WD40 repeat protein
MRFTRQSFPLLVAMALLPTLGGPSRAPAQDADVEKLITQLGSDDEAQRAEATKKLKELGEKAAPPLRKAAKEHADVDVRLRAGLVLREIEAPLTREVHILKGHTATVWTVAVSRDGKRAVSGSDDKTARVWDLESGKELRSWNLGWNVHAVDITADGKQAAVGAATFALYDLEKDRLLKEVKPGAAISRLVLSADGAFALWGDWNGNVVLWDLKEWKQVREFKGHTAVIGGLAFVDKDTILTAAHDRTMRLWDLHGGKELRRYEGHTEAIDNLALSPDGKHALTASWDRTVRLWDIKEGKEIRVFQGQTAPVVGVAFLPGGKRFVTAGHDKTVRVWDVATGKEVRRYENHTDAVWKLAVTRDGRHVLSASQDHTIRVWPLPK